MKSGSKGFSCTQRNSGSKMSQSCTSSSEISSKVCGCGKRLLLLKATIMKNKGILFWRCRNWVVSEKFRHFYWMSILFVWEWFHFVLQTNSHCNYFERVDDKEFDFQGEESEFEVSGGKRVEGGKRGEKDEVCLEREKITLDLIKKNEKLKRKLQQEKKNWDIPAIFICYIVGLNNCNGVHVVVQS